MGEKMKHAIPENILDDRLAFVGTSGAGKTYAAKGAVERLLDMHARVCIVDPLSVWWGLRSSVDGKKAGYPIIVFGGKHADVEINENSGAALAKLVAAEKFSTIVDLGEFGTGASRRRFMVGFLEELYSANREPLHLILDEADLWAPQRPMPDQTALLNRTEEIVRRGRVRGFIPWLITQRPAVVHKDVLSQADVLVALKLTSSQDRDALGSWIEGQADKAEEKRIRAALPGLQRGEGFVWAPTHGILNQVTFPAIRTFDSSRTPKRGESVAGPAKVADVNLAAVRAQLAEVEVKVKEGSPEHLRKIIGDLQTELRSRKAPAVDGEALNAEYRRGYDQGQMTAREVEARQHAVMLELSGELHDLAQRVAKAVDAWPVVEVTDLPPTPQRLADESSPDSSYMRRNPPEPRQVPTGAAPERILKAVAWWHARGHDAPTRVQVAFLARYSPRSSGYEKQISNLSSAGLIAFPAPGCLALVDQKSVKAEVNGTAVEAVQAVLSPRMWRVLQPLLKGKTLTRGQLAEASEYSDRSSGYEKTISQLKGLSVIEFPSQGHVKAVDWLFEVR